MASNFKFSYHQRLFVMLLAFSAVFVGCFVAFQYQREKDYKVAALNSQLQLYNMGLLDAINQGENPSDYLANTKLPFDSLRVTVIDADNGAVTYDNAAIVESNHLERPEIAAALSQGSGYSVRRHSASTGRDYFYAALRGGDRVVRTAVPYSLPLTEVLSTDKTFLWFILAVTLILATVAYFVTRRLGQSVSRLNRFAQKAERGERVYDDLDFPGNELGEISHNIVRLYTRLQRATIDLKREHANKLHEEREKVRIKKQLTNNINHELKTPVAAIQVCLETLTTHPEIDDATRRQFVDRAYAQTQRLVKLLDDVGTITRLDDGAKQIDFESVNLAQTVNEAIALVPASDMSVHVQIPPKMTVRANPAMLQSIFRNLIENAVAYSEGSRIDIKADETADGKALITFADNGTGVPDEHLAHLFERFYRVDKGRSRTHGGTGLGLAIVKNSVNLHGGTIAVSNCNGLRFEFTLPLS